jgi:hypothetical protein
MATFFDQIWANIQALIPTLNNVSETGPEKQIARAVGLALDVASIELTNSQTNINSIIGQRFGSAADYVRIAKAYQEGYSLSINALTLEYYYSVIDLTALLVVQAACEVVSSGDTQVITLKVAKLDTVTNKLAALTSGEKTDFDSYFQVFEIPGLPVKKVSLDPNIFGFNAEVSYYNQYSLTGIQSAIAAALITFRDSYEFNGELYTNDLETYLKNNVAGIRNVSLSNTQIDSVNFTGYISLTAGYFDYIDLIETNFTYVSA